MEAKRVAFLSLLFALFAPCQLQNCPASGISYVCSSEASAGDWQSRVMSMRGARVAGSPTATQIISWTEDPNLPAGLDYVVVTRKNVAGSQRVLSMPTNSSNGFALSLPYDTRYELLVCYSNVSLAMLPSPGSSPPLFPECGLCSSCFRTGQPITLNITSAVILDNLGSDEVIFECEASSDPIDGITFIWTATRVEDNVTVQLNDSMEIITVMEESSTVSTLTLERGGEYRHPACTAMNGLNVSRDSDEFSRISLGITEATIQGVIDENEVLYQCTATGSPLSDIKFMWVALREDTDKVMRLSGNIQNLEIDTMRKGMMTVVSILKLEGETPFIMPACTASLGELVVTRSADEFEFLPDITNHPETFEMVTDEPGVVNTPKGNQITVSTAAIVGLVAVPVIVTPLAVIIGILIYRRFRINKRKKKMRAHSVELLQQSIMQQEGGNINGGTDLQYSMRKSPEADVNSSVLELRKKLPGDMIIDPTDLKVTVVIGQGEFGVIYKAHYYQHENQSVVAVKTLKGIFTTAGDIESATKEILKMYKFNHLNVMSLIGVCMAPPSQGSSAGPSMVMPFMAKGSLLDYLRKEASNLKASSEAEVPRVRKELLRICQQIAKGMEYLAGMNFIHRDLAARNCLMDGYGVIKVSDFGLTENLYTRNYFRQVNDGAKLPIKWMALESIKLGLFTEKSDMWAYGVTCWEVFTGGSIPYPGLHPREVLDILENVERLHKPKNLACCSSMYNLLLSCWHEKEENRPTFSSIVQELEHFLEVTSDYLDLGAVSAYTTDNDDDRTSSEAEVASLPGIDAVQSHSLLDRIASSPNDYAIAGL